MQKTFSYPNLFGNKKCKTDNTKLVGNRKCKTKHKICRKQKTQHKTLLKNKTFLKLKTQVNLPLVSSPTMHTPHLDALAKTSLQFNKAFVQVTSFPNRSLIGPIWIFPPNLFRSLDQLFKFLYSVSPLRAQQSLSNDEQVDHIDDIDNIVNEETRWHHFHDSLGIKPALRVKPYKSCVTKPDFLALSLSLQSSPPPSPHHGHNN